MESWSINSIACNAKRNFIPMARVGLSMGLRSLAAGAPEGPPDRRPLAGAVGAGRRASCPSARTRSSRCARSLGFFQLVHERQDLLGEELHALLRDLHRHGAVL